MGIDKSAVFIVSVDSGDGGVIKKYFDLHNSE